MSTFFQGSIVKSTSRSDKKSLFLMVLEDVKSPTKQFNGVVLKDMSSFEMPDGTREPEHKSGQVTNIWNIDMFKLSSWDEFKKWL